MYPSGEVCSVQLHLTGAGLTAAALPTGAEDVEVVSEDAPRAGTLVAVDGAAVAHCDFKKKNADFKFM